MIPFRPIEIVAMLAGAVTGLLVSALVSALLSLPAHPLAPVPPSSPDACLTAPTGSGWSGLFPEGE